MTLSWEPYELLMILGGLILLGSACLFVYLLFKTQFSATTEVFEAEVEYAETYQPVTNLPEYLNDIKLWNKVIAVLMFISFGIPILQFFFLDTYDSSAWDF